MDWARIHANWQHFKTLAWARWGRISAEQFDLIAGQREQLAGHIHLVYGISRKTAQMQLESWQGMLKDPA